MRLLAYITPSDDAAAVRDHLRALPGITGVAMRSGRHWHVGDRPEHGYQRVWAPEFPGILAAYAAAGIEAFACAGPVGEWRPDELTTLPAADTVTVLAHGTYAREELQAVGTVGTVIVINHSGHLLDAAPEYLVANDGIMGKTIGAPGQVRCVRRLHLTSLPSGPWFALDRVGVRSGIFSIRCALRLAHQALAARRIRLIGHDCVAGAGSLPGTWATGHMATCKRETAADLGRLAATGIEIDHVGWDADRHVITRSDYRA